MTPRWTDARNSPIPAGDPMALAGTVKSLVSELNPRTGAIEIQPMAAFIAEAQARNWAPAANSRPHTVSMAFLYQLPWRSEGSYTGMRSAALVRLA